MAVIKASQKYRIVTAIWLVISCLLITSGWILWPLYGHHILVFRLIREIEQGTFTPKHKGETLFDIDKLDERLSAIKRLRGGELAALSLVELLRRNDDDDNRFIVVLALRKLDVRFTSRHVVLVDLEANGSLRY